MGHGKGREKRVEARSETFDLTQLMAGFHSDFLLALKEMLVERRLRVSLKTIRQEFEAVTRILKACHEAVTRVSQERGQAPPMFDRIDRDLLTALWAITGDIPGGYLVPFRSIFIRERANEALFAQDVAEVDFPSKGSQGRTVTPGDQEGTGPSVNSFMGKQGRLRQHVLVSALSKAVMVQILNITEDAFEKSRLSLGVYAYSRLLMCRAARPESTRLLRCRDLLIDTKDGNTVYFLSMSIPKARVSVRPEATVPLHEEVGKLLDAQRAAVIARFGHLITKKNSRLSGDESIYTAGDLPLFPAGGLTGRMRKATQERLGFMAEPSAVTHNYIDPLKKLTKVKLMHNVMRHTMGTQLALAGCSASTIAAVLLHATDQTAQVYVDLFFDGAIDELSDSLEPAFLEHFPVIKTFMSVNDPIEAQRRITSETPDDERIEMTGGCGGKAICSYAPITCYECPRFIPAYDADHSINLKTVEQEIHLAERGGLARKREAQQYRHIANRIRVVMMVCEAKNTAVHAERKAAEPPQ